MGDENNKSFVSSLPFTAVAEAVAVLRAEVVIVPCPSGRRRGCWDWPPFWPFWIFIDVTGSCSGDQRGRGTVCSIPS